LFWDGSSVVHPSVVTSQERIMSQFDVTITNALGELTSRAGPH